MAGAGFRTFAAGEVLTASNVNTYLMEQSIMNFAGTAARSSAISLPSEGMFAYLQDTNTLTFYNGSAWVNAGSAIAGTALSSGTATSGQVLTANGSGGVSFSTGTQGLTLLNTTSFSAVSSFSLAQDTFTSTYENYKLIFTLSGNTADATPTLRMRKAGVDATGGNYHGAWYGYRSNATSDQYGYLNQTSQSLGSTESTFNDYYYSWQIDIYQPKLSVYTKTWFQNMGSDGSSNYVARFGGVTHLVADTYDSVTIAISSGNFSGKYSIYGYNL